MSSDQQHGSIRVVRLSHVELYYHAVTENWVIAAEHTSLVDSINQLNINLRTRRVKDVLLAQCSTGFPLLHPRLVSPVFACRTAMVAKLTKVVFLGSLIRIHVFPPMQTTHFHQNKKKQEHKNSDTIVYCVYNVGHLARTTSMHEHQNSLYKANRKEHEE